MKKLLFISFLTFNFTLFSQNLEVETLISSKKNEKPASNIVKLNASEFEKVVVKNALYDAKRNNLPYYISNQKTSLQTQVFAKLIAKNTTLLTGEFAQAIRLNFGKYLTANFQINTRSEFQVLK